ncbi:MAG TPA: alkaline phosphatase family protein [Mycobacteriales bacterium]|nr:alkaline phosphatase family protein [Mycobacteriales bacterium]
MNIIVFIDGLGYESAAAIGFDRLFTQARPLRPGIGYTVNITTEIFAGLTPDAAGFFNKWGVCPGRAPLRRFSPATRALGILDRWPRADLAVRKALRHRGMDTARIPWRHCATFGKIGTDVLHGPNTPRSVIGSRDIVLAHPHGMPGPDDDPAVIEMAHEAVRSGRDVILYLTYLDGLGHDFGPESKEYLTRAEYYRDALERLMEQATKADPQSRVAVISDHSMSAVERHVAAPPEVPRSRCFIDSVIIRSWGDAAVRALDPLLDAGHGQLLDEADRARFGVQNREWGDAILLLQPGGLFVPDYFTGIYRPADEPARGMHGYHPDREETWGLFFTHGLTAPAGPGPISAVDSHSALITMLDGSHP